MIIDDISRLARGLEALLQLRAGNGQAHGILEFPTLEFGEDSDSVFVENLLASVSQHQRQKYGERTVSRMRARLLSGFWVFQTLVGYRFERRSGQGNRLVRDEPLASIVQEDLEDHASGRLQLQREFKVFLASQLECPKAREGTVSAWRTNVRC